MGRAEEETGARRALELALENRASSEQARLAALDDALASERRLVAERTAEVSHLERRAVRAEDRLRETERQLAKARAEAAVGVALSAPPPGAGPFRAVRGGNAASPIGRRREPPRVFGDADALGTATRLPTTTNEGASSLRLELKARTRQTHKLQEVCAGLKRRFVDQGLGERFRAGQRRVRGGALRAQGVRAEAPRRARARRTARAGAGEDEAGAGVAGGERTRGGGLGLERFGGARRQRR